LVRKVWPNISYSATAKSSSILIVLPLFASDTPPVPQKVIRIVLCFNGTEPGVIRTVHCTLSIGLELVALLSTSTLVWRALEHGSPHSRNIPSLETAVALCNQSCWYFYHIYAGREPKKTLYSTLILQSYERRRRATQGSERCQRVLMMGTNLAMQFFGTCAMLPSLRSAYESLPLAVELAILQKEYGKSVARLVNDTTMCLIT